MTFNKQTKIVCTIGPASDNYEIILKMADAGMNVVRLNFSHGDHETAIKRIELVRKVEKENMLNIGIMIDTKGPEIRLGKFINDVEEYTIGEIVTICKEEILGSNPPNQHLSTGKEDPERKGDIGCPTGCYQHPHPAEEQARKDSQEGEGCKEDSCILYTRQEHHCTNRRTYTLCTHCQTG